MAKLATKRWYLGGGSAQAFKNDKQTQTMELKINKTKYYNAMIARFGSSAVEYLFLNHSNENPTEPEIEVEIDAVSEALNTLANTVSDTIAEVIDNPWQFVLPIPVDESPAQTDSSEVVPLDALPVISVHASPVISDNEEEEEME